MSTETRDPLLRPFVEASDDEVAGVELAALVEAHALPLARKGRAYAWQVTARRGGDTVISPAAPAPPARFGVLDAASVDTLRRMEARHADSHVLLGILNLQAGVVAGAVWHFERVARDDPYADVARRSLEGLRRPEANSR